VQKIAIRLSVLKDLQRFLVQFSEDIREKSAEYSHRVKQLPENGVAVQIAEYYEVNFGTQNLQHLQNLIAAITDIHLPHIKTAIAKLEEPFLLRDTAGNIVARVIGDRIWDNSGNWLYEIRGDRIYDSSGNWRYEFRADRIYDTAGNWRYELRDDRVYDTAGNWLGSEY
jgi:hypothetical protein